MLNLKKHIAPLPINFEMYKNACDWVMMHSVKYVAFFQEFVSYMISSTKSIIMMIILSTLVENDLAGPELHYYLQLIWT